MIRHLLRRALYGLAVLAGVNLLTFFLFFTVNTPDDMARLKPVTTPNQAPRTVGTMLSANNQ